MPDGQVLEIINVDRIECTRLSTRSFSITDGKRENCFLVEHPQSSTEWIAKIEEMKREPSDVLEEEKKNQISNILKKIRLAEVTAARNRAKSKMKPIRGQSQPANKESPAATATAEKGGAVSNKAEQGKGPLPGGHDPEAASNIGYTPSSKSVSVFQKLFMKLKGTYQSSDHQEEDKAKESGGKCLAEISQENTFSVNELKNYLDGKQSEKSKNDSPKHVPLSTLVIKDSKSTSTSQPRRVKAHIDHKNELIYTLQPVNIRKAVMSDAKRYSYIVDIGSIKEFPYRGTLNGDSNKTNTRTPLTPPESSEDISIKVVTPPDVSETEIKSSGMKDFQVMDSCSGITKSPQSDKNADKIKQNGHVSSDIKNKILDKLGQDVKQSDSCKPHSDTSSAASWDESPREELNKGKSFSAEGSLLKAKNSRGVSRPEISSDELLAESKLLHSDSSNDECLDILKKHVEKSWHNKTESANHTTSTIDVKYKPFLGMRSSVPKLVKEVDIDEETTSAVTINGIDDREKKRWGGFKLFTFKSHKKDHPDSNKDLKTYTNHDDNLECVPYGDNMDEKCKEDKATESSCPAIIQTTSDLKKIHVIRDSEHNNQCKAIQHKKKEFLGPLGNFLVLWKAIHHPGKRVAEAKIKSKLQALSFEKTPKKSAENVNDSKGKCLTNSAKSKQKSDTRHSEVPNITAITPPNPVVSTEPINQDLNDHPVDTEEDKYSSPCASVSAQTSNKQISLKKSKGGLLKFSANALNFKAPFAGKLVGSKVPRNTKSRSAKVKVTQKQTRSRTKSRKPQDCLKEAI